MTPDNRAQSNETEFREFANKLLAAEVLGFERGTPLYSAESLQKVMAEFCKIVAETLQTQSCTIQLKSYDIRTITEGAGAAKRTAAAKLLTALTQDPKERITERLGIANPWDGIDLNFKDDPQTRDQYRKELALAGITYPHAIYPKGVVRLVAANPGSPWEGCVEWSLTSLESGITTQIVQGKAARVRDKLEIRATRSFNKLGPLDPVIWHNQPLKGESPRFFYNYYGVPIRIHQRGEVIGILRVENKGLTPNAKLVGPNIVPKGSKSSTRPPAGSIHGLIDRFLTCSFNAAPENFHGDLAAMWTKLVKLRKQVVTAGFAVPPPSYFGAVYLAHDAAVEAIASLREAIQLRDLCCAQYPLFSGQTNTLIDNSVWVNSKSRPKAIGRPPIQVMFASLFEEGEFLEALGGHTRRENVQKGKSLLQRAEAFYRHVNSALATDVVGLHDSIHSHIKEAIATFPQAPPDFSVEVAAPDLADAPDFLSKVTIVLKSKKRFHFYLQVLPGIDELPDDNINHPAFESFWFLTVGSAKKYLAINKSGGPFDVRKIKGVRVTEGESQIIHFDSDRIASRVQALTCILPVPDFTTDDAWKLSWAAVELGKLVERHISYRGNSLHPPIPLTAMDFYRIPISDLSFVDALQRQEVRAQAVTGMLCYHVPILCKNMGFVDKLNYIDRIKNYRGYFERIGSVHAAYFDSVMALWVAFLAVHIGQKSPSGVTFCEGLWKQINEVAVAVDNCIGDLKEPNEPARFTDYLAKHIGHLKWSDQPYADVLLIAPPVTFSYDSLPVIASNLRTAPSFPPGSNDELSDRDIYFGAFLSYDRFINFTTSLYSQIRNQQAWEEGKAQTPYVEFYRVCSEAGTKLRHLLQELSMEGVRVAATEGEDTVHGRANKDGLNLVNVLMGAKAEILGITTSELANALRHLGDHRELCDAVISPNTHHQALARLTVLGIYKRLRTMVNIAGDQLSPALLNWDTLKFDYVGYRVNCLFKNQVFAAYERIWNRGDPFLRWTASGPDNDRPSGQETSRQRWLSMRTRVHEGEEGYYAWQIWALMDPHAVEEGYWHQKLYTINKVRDYMSRAHVHWHTNEANSYRQLALRREQWRREYIDWFGEASDIVGGKIEHTGADTLKKFGEYLCQAATDELIEGLVPSSSGTMRKIVMTGELLRTIKVFFAEAFRYSEHWRNAMKTNKRSDVPVLNAALSLAAHAVAVYADTKLEWSERGGQPEIPEEEQMSRPVVYMTEDLALRFEEFTRGDLTMRGAVQRWLREQLIEFQRMQKEYLFFLKSGRNEAHPRSRAEVLSKVLCYAVMLRSDDISSANEFRDWTSYDLFYYLVGLTPVEFQVRTSLSNTMAEQYHSIYKAEDVAHAAQQKLRLNEIGRKLEELDCETEVVYEDYVQERFRRSKHI